MDFKLSSEQKMLKKSIKDFMRKEYSAETLNDSVDGEIGYSPEEWHKITDLGWAGLVFPEQYGGSGYSFFEMMILLEEMGYFLYHGPYFATVLLGGLSILFFGDRTQKDAFLPRIAGGEKHFTMAISEPGSQFHDPSGINLSAQKAKGGYVVEGTKVFVPDARIADYILCVGRTEGNADPKQGITVFILDAANPDIKITPLKTLSGRRQSMVGFNKVFVSSDRILGNAHHGWEIVEKISNVAALGSSIEMVGYAQAAFDRAVLHSKSRVQFGRPIGGFQAIQHYITNMWISISSARMLCMRAASKFGNGQGDAEKEIAMAKFKAGETARMVTTKAHQILGAIGFTEEYDMHWFTRRAITDDLFYGDQEFQKERIAVGLGL